MPCVTFKNTYTLQTFTHTHKQAIFFDLVTSGLQDQPLYMLQHIIDEADNGMGQLIPLVLGLGGCWVLAGWLLVLTGWSIPQFSFIPNTRVSSPVLPQRVHQCQRILAGLGHVLDGGRSPWPRLSLGVEVLPYHCRFLQSVIFTNITSHVPTNHTNFQMPKR